MSENILHLLAILWVCYVFITTIYHLLIDSPMYPYIDDIFRKLMRDFYKILEVLKVLVFALLTFGMWGGDDKSIFRWLFTPLYDAFITNLNILIAKFFSVSLSTHFHNFFTLKVKTRIDKLASASLATHLSNFFYFYFRRFAILSYRRYCKWVCFARRFAILSYRRYCKWVRFARRSALLCYRWYRKGIIWYKNLKRAEVYKIIGIFAYLIFTIVFYLFICAVVLAIIVFVVDYIFMILY